MLNMPNDSNNSPSNSSSQVQSQPGNHALTQVTASSACNDSNQVIIDAVLDVVNQHLHRLFRQMIADAENYTRNATEAANTEQQRQRLEECALIISHHENSLAEQYFRNLNALLAPSGQDDEVSTLVYQDEMEEMIAITTMHSKAMKVFGDEVNNMEARLEYLELLCANMFDKESLDPKHLCEVFQKTIESLAISAETKMLFYKLFDREVCMQLGAMYAEINKILVKHDIMPEIMMTTADTDDYDYQEQGVVTSVATYYDPTEKVHTDFIPRTKEEMSRIVNEFMSGETTITENEIELPESFLRAPTKDDLTGENCYERTEVLKALSALQRKIRSLDISTTELISSNKIKQEMISGFESGEDPDKHVNLLDERSMDFVGMMFNAIAEDDTVSKVMTSLIYRLQIPVMKLAMTDTQLFENEEHPARLTVDMLTRLGKGIDNREDRLYLQLEKVVNAILDNFDADVHVFGQAVTSLEQLKSVEEERTRELELKQQKEFRLAHARDVVVQLVKKLTGNMQVPQSIKPLTMKLMPTLMLNRYLQHGHDSLQWVEAVSLYKKILMFLQPLRRPGQYQRLQQSYTGLTDTVEATLATSRQNRELVNKQLDELRSHFTTVLEQAAAEFEPVIKQPASIDKADTAPATANDAVQSSTDTEDDKHDSVTQQNANSGGASMSDNGQAVTANANGINQESSIEQDIEKEAQQELDRIRSEAEAAQQKLAAIREKTHIGAWYQVYNGEDKPIRRLKLSVLIEESGVLIFVDRRGNKVIEKPVDDFMTELEQEKTCMIADHSTFDNALGNVINALAA